MAVGWAILSAGGYPDRTVAPAIGLAEKADLLAVCSRDMGRAEEFARKHGARAAYASVVEVLNDPRVDAVYVASPNHLHAPYTEMAAKAGKHVLVEKPMALTVAEGVEMVRTCKARGVKLGVGFQLRLHPGRIEAKRLIASGTMGTVALAQSHFGRGTRGVVRPPLRSGLSEWWEQPEMTGGALTMMGQGVHCIDDLHFMLGQQVVEVAAITDGQTPEKPLEHLAAMCLRFSGGAIGMMCCGGRMPDFKNEVAIYGSNGKIVLMDAYPPRLQGELQVTSDAVNTVVPYQPDALALVKGQIEGFGRAIESDGEPAASGIDGLKVVQVTVAMIESASTGRTVKMEPLPV